MAYGDVVKSLGEEDIDAPVVGRHQISNISKGLACYKALWEEWCIYFCFPGNQASPLIAFTLITGAEWKVIELIIKAALASTTTKNCPFIWDL